MILHICPRCGGEGTARDTRRPLGLCRHCAGQGTYFGRPYGQARHCDHCRRVYNPPLAPNAREARYCTFCRPNGAGRGLPYCRACNGPIHPLPTGRPRLYCERCRPYRRHQRLVASPTLLPGIAGASA